MSPSIRVGMLTGLVQAAAVSGAHECSAVQSVRAPVCMCENFLELVFFLLPCGSQ